jgi:hypothetical protein
MEPDYYAFLLAYKCWLECDAHYLASLRGNPQALDDVWLRDIARTYLVNRTIPKGQEAPVKNTIVFSGQGNDMSLRERAARLSVKLTKEGITAASAVSKISWFIWPSGWTMYDRFARLAVIGPRPGKTVDLFDSFYVALAMRGWDDLLKAVRVELRAGGMKPLLAERTIDKHLMLTAMGPDQRQRIGAALDNFMKELPQTLQDSLHSVSEQLAPILQASPLLHRDTPTDQAALAAQLASFQTLKQQIA